MRFPSWKRALFLAPSFSSHYFNLIKVLSTTAKPSLFLLLPLACGWAAGRTHDEKVGLLLAKRRPRFIEPIQTKRNPAADK
ncbi:hypothetical protein BDV34DRAFT_186538 [Aspergillus parasiticus]|uniref:Uncharacterized protein n=1 Tax=Aspergillus parasiticus TaxID=5067 RepID=A0A5N6E004_ASPPA|nr:hypothetical protein BDV34DRAFT_186538 [Aspergillus parasiticus]